MNDHHTTIIELIFAVEQFRDEREWQKFHNPGNLASAISIEAAELLEVFQWRSCDGIDYEHAEEELADIVIYCLLFASVTGIDVSSAIRSKMGANALKYPVKDWKGISKWGPK